MLNILNELGGNEIKNTLQNWGDNTMSAKWMECAHDVGLVSVSTSFLTRELGFMSEFGISSQMIQALGDVWNYPTAVYATDMDTLT